MEVEPTNDTAKAQGSGPLALRRVYGGAGYVRERRQRAAEWSTCGYRYECSGRIPGRSPPDPIAQQPRARYPIVHPLDLRGTVIVQVIIDTTGFVVPGSVALLHSSDDRLTQPVLDVVPQLRFVPADSHHRKVRVRTELTFSYPPPSPTIPGIIRPLVGRPS